MLSGRQKEILMAIVEEFMKSADEIGSMSLLKHHNLGVSSATIRSEMVRLMNEGLLEKTHISSGRTPTDTALRMYVQDITSEQRLQPFDEVEVQQGVFKVRFSQEQLIKQILDLLVEKCQTAAFYLSEDDTRYFGISSLMKYDEMQNVETLRRVLDALEDENLLRNIFERYPSSNTVSIIIGSESGIKDLEDCSIAFTPVKLLKGKEGHMGVIGSRRLNYKMVVPLLNLIRNSVEHSLRGWV